MGATNNTELRILSLPLSLLSPPPPLPSFRESPQSILSHLPEVWFTPQVDERAARGLSKKTLGFQFPRPPEAEKNAPPSNPKRPISQFLRKIGKKLGKIGSQKRSQKWSPRRVALRARGCVPWYCWHKEGRENVPNFWSPEIKKTVPSRTQNNLQPLLAQNSVCPWVAVVRS